jgi:hypothetical protein
VPPALIAWIALLHRFITTWCSCVASPKEAFPKHVIHEIKEPLYANVKGFQIAGTNYLRSSLEKVERAEMAQSEPRLVKETTMREVTSIPLEPIRMVLELEGGDDPRPYDDLIQFKKGTNR